MPTAGHERKHNACRAEVGGCVSGYTYISRVKGPQNVNIAISAECTVPKASVVPQVRSTRSPQYARRSTRRRTPRSAGYCG